MMGLKRAPQFERRSDYEHGVAAAYCVRSSRSGDCHPSGYQTGGVCPEEWVLAMVKASADTVDYDIDMEVISKLIDDLCKMSKTVNAPDESEKAGG